MDDSMRQQGRLAEWNDDRGFGFIAPQSGGPRVFAHISAFPHGRRPLPDDEVTFVEGQGTNNRVSASAVKYVGAERSGRRPTRGLIPALVLAALFVGLLVALVTLDRAPMMLLIPYALFSLLAVAMYGADKSAARRGTWRVSEANLHLVGVVGGWPGALVARHAFRHKTRKQPFRSVFWVTVVINCVALVLLVAAAPWS